MAAKCFAEGLKLFRLRPKIHFQQHLTLLMGAESSPVAFSALSGWAGLLRSFGVEVCTVHALRGLDLKGLLVLDPSN